MREQKDAKNHDKSKNLIAVVPNYNCTSTLKKIYSHTQSKVINKLTTVHAKQICYK